MARFGGEGGRELLGRFWYVHLDPVETVGLVATGLAWVQFVPQVVRTARSGDVSGVSPAMWAVLAAQAIAWMVFGARAGLVPSIATNVVLGTAAAVMLVLLARDRARGYVRALSFLGVVVAIEAATLVGLPNAAMGLVAAALSTVAFVPQARTALRSDDLSGLSRSMWVLSVVAGLAWCTYGIGRASFPIWASAGFSTLLSAVVLARIVAVERSLAVVSTGPAAAESLC
jgi:MtN3 and saliva related transmembrane protein